MRNSTYKKALMEEYNMKEEERMLGFNYMWDRKISYKVPKERGKTLLEKSSEKVTKFSEIEASADDSVPKNKSAVNNLESSEE